MEHERVILYPEDKTAINKAGYNISSWSTSQAVVPEPIEVVIVEKQGTRRVAAVRHLHDDGWVVVDRKYKL